MTFYRYRVMARGAERKESSSTIPILGQYINKPVTRTVPVSASASAARYRRPLVATQPRSVALVAVAVELSSSVLRKAQYLSNPCEACASCSTSCSSASTVFARLKSAPATAVSCRPHRPARRRATTPQMVFATMAELERSIQTAFAALTAPTAALVSCRHHRLRRRYRPQGRCAPSLA